MSSSRTAGLPGSRSAKAPWRSVAELVDAEWILTGAREPLEREFAEVFAGYGLNPPVAMVQAESMIGVAALLSMTDALALIEEVRPRRAILTNLHTDLDYETLRRRLPEGVVPAYDGLTATVEA